MNNTRRKQISEIIEQLESIKGDIEALRGEEQGYIDAMPENLQGSERAESAEEAISNLDLAMENMDECISCLEDSKI